MWIASTLAIMRGKRGMRPRRPSPAQVRHATKNADWWDRSILGFLACTAGFYALMGAWGARDGWDGLRAEIVGVTGTVAIRQCEESNGRRDPQFWTSGWSCTGTFTANQGDLHLDHVRVFLHADSRPGPALPARMSGPSATEVWPDGEIEWLFALLLAASAPFALWLFLRWAVETVEPENGWPAPPRPKSASDPTGSRQPQLGNRARRRRRSPYEATTRVVAAASDREGSRPAVNRSHPRLLPTLMWRG